MDFEKIESDYKNQLDDLKKVYVESEKKMPQPEYLAKIRAIREQYYQQMNKYIAFERKKIAHTPRRKKVVKKPIKGFKAQTVDFTKTRLERWQLRYKIASFRYKVFLDRMGGLQSKSFILYHWISLRVFIKRVKRDIENFLLYQKNAFLALMRKWGEKIKVKLIPLHDKYKEVVKKIKTYLAAKWDSYKKRREEAKKAKEAQKTPPPPSETESNSDQSKSTDQQS